MDIDEVVRRLQSEGGPPEEPEEEDKDLLSAYGVDKEYVKTMRGDKTERGKKMAMYLQMIHVHSEIAVPYFKLGQALAHDELIRLRSGALVSRRDLWSLGIQRDPTNAKAYYSLARELRRPDDVLGLADGRTMNKKELCAEALRHRPQFCECAAYLAGMMSNDETVELQEGQKVGRRALLLMAIEANPTFYRAYNSLAYDMLIDDVVTVGTKHLLKKDLYALAIAHGPNDARAYVNLGALLEPGETVKLPLSGITMTQQQLYLEALNLDPTNVVALHNLAISLKRGSTITLRDGSEFTTQQLLTRALEINPRYTVAYNSLAFYLTKKETVLLRSPGQDFDDPPTAKSKRELYQLGGTIFMKPIGLEEEKGEEMRIIETPPSELKKRKKRAKRRAGPPKPRKPKPPAEGTRERLIRFFEAHDPPKVAEVDRLLPLMGGREEERFRVLVELYGPEPPDPTRAREVQLSDDVMDDVDAMMAAGGSGGGGRRGRGTRRSDRNDAGDDDDPDEFGLDAQQPLGPGFDLQGGGRRTQFFSSDDDNDGLPRTKQSLALPDIMDDEGSGPPGNRGPSFSDAQRPATSFW